MIFSILVTFVCRGILLSLIVLALYVEGQSFSCCLTYSRLYSMVLGAWYIALDNKIEET